MSWQRLLSVAPTAHLRDQTEGMANLPGIEASTASYREGMRGAYHKDLRWRTVRMVGNLYGAAYCEKDLAALNGLLVISGAHRAPIRAVAGYRPGQIPSPGPLLR